MNDKARFEQALHQAWDEGRDPFADPVVQAWLEEHPGEAAAVADLDAVLGVLGSGGAPGMTAARARPRSRRPALVAAAVVLVILAGAAVSGWLRDITWPARSGGFPPPPPLVGTAGYPEGFLGVQRFEFHPGVERGLCVTRRRVVRRWMTPDGSVLRDEHRVSVLLESTKP